MDELDGRILRLLGVNGRMTLKEMARRVSLTSPAVSERIRRMEKKGIIQGYTVRVNPDVGKAVHALISIYVQPPDRPAFEQLLAGEAAVRDCFQVTGTMSHMVKVACRDIPELNSLINRMQKLGQTNTQIILSSMFEERL